ncbi:MAG: hypothetical protein JWN72_2358 [Thermoleophilia bacterium]|nr:hypothetical protein [Thermoleophilia bacterium]
MRFMQVIEARDVHDARDAYLKVLNKRGVDLVPSMAVYVETVHRHRQVTGSWLCYVAQAVPMAA